MENNKKQRSLYLDMDDVVADWMTEAKNYLQAEWAKGTYMPAQNWDVLKNHTRFYRHLPLLPGAVELVDWARATAKKNDWHLAFLTAIPHDNSVPYVAHDKVHWAHERFPDIPVLFGPYSFDKQMHCNQGDILIDDRTENCVEWRNAGGIAHQYTTWEECQKWINEDLWMIIEEQQGYNLWTPTVIRTQYDY
jgi:5'(3')-deoxyribonucleotidase